MSEDFDKEILLFTIKASIVVLLVYISALSLICIIENRIYNGHFKVNVPHQEVYIIHADKESNPLNIKEGKRVDTCDSVWIA